MAVRLKQHEASALHIARWLKGRPEVATVLHPALPESADHAVWARDYTGAAGLFGVVLKPCRKRDVHAFLDTLQIFGLGFSWGGFESLALDGDPQFGVRSFRETFEGPVVRLNVGLEDPGDLIADLDRALAVVGAR